MVYFVHFVMAPHIPPYDSGVRASSAATVLLHLAGRALNWQCCAAFILDCALMMDRARSTRSIEESDGDGRRSCLAPT